MFSCSQRRLVSKTSQAMDDDEDLGGGDDAGDEDSTVADSAEEEVDLTGTDAGGGAGLNCGGFPKCDHNFTKNTKYVGIDPDSGDKVWSDCPARSFNAHLLVFRALISCTTTAQLLGLRRPRTRSFHAPHRAKSVVLSDPAPKPPKRIKCDAGDYVLISGDAVDLAKSARMIFDSHNDYILTYPGWESLTEDMTVSDVVDLGEERFLLWWQCIKPPKDNKPDRKQAPGAPTAKQKKKTRKR